jgi:uncharacterized membrane protein
VYRKYADLLAVDVIALAGLASVLLASIDWMVLGFYPIQAALTLPLVLVFPGYALAAALFSRGSLAASERILFSFGGSLAVAVLGGLLLNLTPGGLNAGAWTSLLVAVTLAASAIAIIRRVRATEEAPVEKVRRPRIISPLQGVAFALALLVMGGAVAVARVGDERQPEPAFTQLWLLPATQQGPNTVKIGLQNMEQVSELYHVQLKQGSTVVGDWQQIAVQPGQKWETSLTLPKNLGDTIVEADLYRMDLPGGQTPYRHVTLQGGQ